MTESNEFVWPEWKTVRRIGNGSFGAVYEIERKLSNKVEKAAVKVITVPKNQEEIEELYNEGYNKESITQRYHGFKEDIINEYNLMTEVKGNTNIVYCDDIRLVQHDDGIGWDIFIKMELLTPLLKYLPKDIPEDLVIKLGVDMCNALALCEMNNIFHRDIKPQNIFVSKEGHFKLGDFGIAKTIEQTATGTKAGTFKYMSPEVYNNQSSGHRSDIYSLGLVLYWMLNERRVPFISAEGPVPTTQEEKKAQDRRFAGEVLPEPAYGRNALKYVVLKACEFNPDNRYQSAQEMLYDLEHLDELSESLKNSNDDSETEGKTYRLWRERKKGALTDEEDDGQEIDGDEGSSGSQEDESEDAEDSDETEDQEDGSKQSNSFWDKHKKWIIPSVAAVLVISIGCAVFLNKGNTGNKNGADGQVSTMSLDSEDENAPDKSGDEDSDILGTNQKAWSEIQEICDEVPDFTELTYLETAIVVNRPDNALPLQKAPSSSSVTIDTLRNGTEILIYSRDGQWAFVNCDGVWGWCESTYLVAPWSSEIDFSRYLLETTDSRSNIELNYTAWEDANLEDHEIDWADSGLEAAMRELTGINDREIRLSDVWNYSYLNLKEKGIENVSALSELQNLQVLWLEENQISDLSPLKELANLTHLGLSHNSITNVDELLSLEYLRDLRLDGNSIESLKSIGGMTNLELLYLDGNGLTDISDLMNLQNLQVLTLNNNSIIDVSAISGMVAMKHLWLYTNKIVDVSPLASLKDLRYLSLSDNSIQDVTPICNLENLFKLYLDSNNISVIPDLSTLVRLYELHLDDNNIEDITALSDLKKIVQLRLSGNKIENIEALSDLTELEYLEFDWNDVSDISAVENLKELKVLWAEANHISDISVLSGLTHLEELYINRNNIIDISALKNLRELTVLYIGDNQVDNGDVVELYNSHPGLSIYNSINIDITDALIGNVDYMAYDSVQITSSSATSEWVDPNDESYGQYSEAAYDGLLIESWQEGVDGPGVGESLTLNFDEPTAVSLVRIYPGLISSSEWFNRNNRPLSFEIKFVDGLVFDVILPHYEYEDATHGFVVDLKTSVVTESITITLLSVDESEEDDETPISEVEFFTLRDEPLETAPVGWTKIGNSWYYFDEQSNIQTGWLTLGSDTYYLGEYGRLFFGTFTVDGTTYYANNDGVVED